jgi:hypothetical protein
MAASDPSTRQSGAPGHFDTSVRDILSHSYRAPRPFSMRMSGECFLLRFFIISPWHHPPDVRNRMNEQAHE